MSGPPLEQPPKHAPPLDPGFRPAALGNRAYREAVRIAGGGRPLVIAVERPPESISVYHAAVFGGPSRREEADDVRYAERLVKMLLWQKGGHRVIVDGPEGVTSALRAAYAPGGARAFDAKAMADIYERPFEVVAAGRGGVPPARESSAPRGRHLDGCRIGFDAGASDRKVAAVIDGRTVFSEEVVWDPKPQRDPGYHFDQINAALKAAAARLPRVDAIGVSSAGVYVNNRVMIASLFRGVPADLFTSRVRDLFLEIRRAWNDVPLEVCNDGDVTALAGSMNLDDGAVLGIAMGSSEAAGYVTPEGNLTDWLNELAFAPVDHREDAPVDEWSGDAGCGVQYLSQVAAIRLAEAAGLHLPVSATPAEKLKAIQAAHDRGERAAADVFASIGTYLGYALAHYADFYDLRHALILGRVTSGKGGDLIRARAQAVLKDEFPELHGRVKLHLPEEESERRVGQAIAAASLPLIGS